MRMLAAPKRCRVGMYPRVECNYCTFDRWGQGEFSGRIVGLIYRTRKRLFFLVLQIVGLIRKFRTTMIGKLHSQYLLLRARRIFSPSIPNLHQNLGKETAGILIGCPERSPFRITSLPKSGFSRIFGEDLW